jgi:predicted nucleotidyltransferase
MTKKQLKSISSSHGISTAENREVIQELREIKSDIKEVKKFLIINSLRQLVNNYDQQVEKKNKKLAKD